MDLEHSRREYLAGGLRRADMHESPLEQFSLWMRQACESPIYDPTAMVLATVSALGEPSQRIVLLKHFDQEGFVFYTNYKSKKAQDIQHNSKVSLLFPWHQLDRQVKLQGVASKVSVAESLKYFVSRPLDSQFAAWASPQSESVSSRQFLLQQYENMKNKFKNGQVPLPDFWGGYRVKVSQYEFWQGGGKRLHDRFQYQFDAQTKIWQLVRLAP